MTRKCVLCKETNYRNTYSFFSAPKDPETRKKWQEAIAIENYAVTDETYVCSKHFLKDDIITHWVSGVPPHVITIKYKKCRLRPGAVPVQCYPYDESILVQEHSDDSDMCTDSYQSTEEGKTDTAQGDHTGFLIPRTEERIQRNNDDGGKVSCLQLHSHDFNGTNYVPKGAMVKIELSEDSLNSFSNELAIEDTCHQDISTKNQKRKEHSIKDYTILDRVSINEQYKSIETSTKSSNISEDKVTVWKSNTLKKKASEESLDDSNLRVEENVHIDERIVNNTNYNELETYYTTCNDIGENELLFEDLLEVCTEVLLPRGWSCLVTSKGHTTTIVYLYMGMTKGGMPFTEKQVYIKSDMMLHCTAINREIDPFIHNFIREGKHLKVKNLVDIEELIDEFDQRTVCQGIYNTEGFQEISRIKVAYKDGIKWRHILCPLILNNDSTRCIKCISISRMLQRKSIKPSVLSQNPSVLSKEQQRVHSIRQKYKRATRQGHRYEFIKIFKQ